MSYLAPGSLKEVDQQFATLLGPHPGRQLDTVVQPWIITDVVETQAGPGLHVRRPVDQSFQSRVDRRSATHQTGFKGDDQGALPQPPATNHIGCVSQGQDFGMSCRVASQLTLIVSTSNYLTVPSHNGSNGYITMIQGRFGFVQGQAHQLVISHADTLRTESP